MTCDVSNLKGIIQRRAEQKHFRLADTAMINIVVIVFVSLAAAMAAPAGLEWIPIEGQVKRQTASGDFVYLCSYSAVCRPTI